MSKLEFTLKQHTPLIHFQHDQEGATLRATEVKPKFDRFIIERLTNKKDKEAFDAFVQNSEWKSMLIGNGEHAALNYKMKFISPSDAKSIPVSYSETRDRKFRPNFPTIFGNVETESAKKVFRFSENQKLVIVCYSSELRRIISQTISTFFFHYNFGFRQSKGFGSFSIDDFQFDIERRNFFFRADYKSDDYKNLFIDIDLFYRCLKSGLNVKKKDLNGEMIDVMYFKSLMFKYAKKLPIPEQWDKRTMRHALYFDDVNYRNDATESGVYHRRKNPEGTVRFNTITPANRSYYDFRDLLGLSTEQDWLFYRNKKLVKEVAKSENINGQNVRHEIERFQSPITIKPFYNHNDNLWYVYLVTQELPEKYLGANVEARAGRNSTTLTIYPSFNVAEYLNFAIGEFDKNDIEYGRGFNEKNTDEARTIIDVFSQLKNHLTNNGTH